MQQPASAWPASIGSRERRGNLASTYGAQHLQTLIMESNDHKVKTNMICDGRETNFSLHLLLPQHP